MAPEVPESRRGNYPRDDEDWLELVHRCAHVDTPVLSVRLKGHESAARSTANPSSALNIDESYRRRKASVTLGYCPQQAGFR